MIGRLRVSIQQPADGDGWHVVAVHNRPDGLADSCEVRASAFAAAVERVPTLLAELVAMAEARDRA